MARSKIPGPLERRHQVEGAISSDKALATAEAYLQAGRTVEAVDFLRLADAGEKLDALRASAVEQGDVFLLRTVADAQQRAPEREEWQRLADAAQRNGLERYADEARRQAERGE